ncbi:MAG: hypothetical protein JSV91_06695 [Phycisphaerales bacterium]|nr:MAG: hypothetical protein JSV91_06695 [Phycisphaerales bacterium]
MPESNKKKRSRRQKHIKDARGRKVTQLDPMVLYLLKRSEPIEREVVAKIVAEKGVRMTGLERAAMVASLVLLAALICVVIVKLAGGQPWGELIRRMVVPSYLFIWPFIVWGGTRASRFGKIATAMLKHCRCPHCGYDIRDLPADPVDEATVCPECGCAWQLVPKRNTQDAGHE